ncbi:hypothetical protein HQ531_05895 [bacterium]|nr:hypothetical protein [bacterium]
MSSEYPLSQVTELKSHPLVSHSLAILRSKDTDSQAFRGAAQRLSTLVLVTATGGSSSAAIDLLKSHGATDISLLTLISAPEGIKEVFTKHPDISIFTASVDEHLNEQGFIVPGLGDAGDRYFGS